MRKWILGSAIALAAALAFLAVARAQTDRSGAAKTNSKAATFDPRDFTGIWNPAPFMQPKGEVNPLDVGGHPNPLPPFTPAGEATYLANAKFIAAGAVLDCDPFGVSRNFFTPRPFEILLTRDRLVQHFEYYDNWREIWTDGRKIPGMRIPSTWGIPLAVGTETHSSSTRPHITARRSSPGKAFPSASPCTRRNVGSAWIKTP